MSKFKVQGDGEDFSLIDVGNSGGAQMKPAGDFQDIDYETYEKIKKNPKNFHFDKKEITFKRKDKNDNAGNNEPTPS